MSPPLDIGVESRPDGIHWIHRTRADSNGKFYVLIVRDLEKFAHIGFVVESRSRKK